MPAWLAGWLNAPPADACWLSICAAFVGVHGWGMECAGPTCLFPAWSVSYIPPTPPLRLPPLSPPAASSHTMHHQFGATCFGVGHAVLKDKRFDVCIIDEAGQVSRAADQLVG